MLLKLTPLVVLLGRLSSGARSAFTLSWSACNLTTIVDDSVEGFQCATFQVPLDYAQSSAGVANLSLAKLVSSASSKLGSIWIHPGGPGLSGRAYLAEQGSNILNITGGQYDLVTWDTRGTGSSGPVPKCVRPEPYSIYPYGQATQIQQRGALTDGKGTDPDEVALLGNSSVIDAALESYAKTCGEQSVQVGRYVGTTASARDLLALNDAVEGLGKKVNMWAIDYGTVIAQYFANMFPDRVGRVVLDGVVRAELWATAPPYTVYSTHSATAEEAYTNFLQWCVAVRDTGDCGLINPADNVTSAEQLRATVQSWLDEEADWWDSQSSSKKAAATARGPYTRALIWGNLNNVTQWSIASHTVHHIYSDGVNDHEDPSKSPTPIIAEAVQCGDAIDANYTTTDVLKFIISDAIQEGHNQMFATTRLGYEPVLCHNASIDFHAFIFGWPYRSVERYTGPWNRTLPSPILLIGNTVDPGTPKENAQAVAAAFGSSAVFLEQRGIGHTSRSQPSNCTDAAIRAYFSNGTLPLAGTFCAINGQIYPGSPFLLSGAGNSSTTSPTTVVSSSTATSTSPTSSTSSSSASSRVSSGSGIRAAGGISVVLAIISLSVF